MADSTEREIRNLLHLDAAQVPVPPDMWKNLAARIEKESAARRRVDTRDRKRQWRNAMAFTAVAAAFWLAVLPTALNRTGDVEMLLENVDVHVVSYDPRHVDGAVRRQGLSDWAAGLAWVVPTESSLPSVITIR